MTIKTENITATYVDNITIDIVLFNGNIISVRLHDKDIIKELQTDEFFFEDQRNIDWLMRVGQIVFIGQ